MPTATDKAMEGEAKVADNKEETREEDKPTPMDVAQEDAEAEEAPKEADNEDAPTPMEE